MSGRRTLCILAIAVTLNTILSTARAEGNSVTMAEGAVGWAAHQQVKRNVPFQLCGGRLVEMVKSVCRGQLFSGYKRRSDPSLLGVFTEDMLVDPISIGELAPSDVAHFGLLEADSVDGPLNDVELLWPSSPKALAFKIMAESKAHQRFRRNISDECCKKACSINEMAKYCGK